jgi:putative tryptophan/tyrosine transport system substrate-binding protein
MFGASHNSPLKRPRCVKVRTPVLGRPMRRREFISLVGCAAAAWPVAAHAQQPSLPIVGILDDSGSPWWVAAFRQGLNEGGLIEGRDVATDLRSTEQYSDLRPLADQLVQRQVAVIAALGGVPAQVAKAATTTIPVVFAVGGDPVEIGLVPNINRPGGNITGATFFAAQLLQKQVGILHDLVSKATTIGVLVNPNNPRHQSDEHDVQTAARTLGLEVHVAKAGDEPDLDAAFVDFADHAAGALIIAGDAFFLVKRAKIISLAAHHGIPMIYNVRDYVISGGLISYGPSVPDVCRQVGIYAARIVKGEKPADLPVVQPTKFDLVINLKTAKVLGLSVPQTLLATADEVIE